MRKCFFVFFLVGTLLLGSCCKIIMPEKPEDVYYLRYEASANIPADKRLQVVFNNQRGEKVVSKIKGGGPFSIVVGPVKYGFEAYCAANTLDSDPDGIYTALYASKNGGPYTFVKMVGGEEYITATLNCTIDF